ncbi:prephenate dehydratase [Granulicella cerasi]|uniref:Prephenate dehydratase n=1 Tax=Granulicella cerasi TaxID=741063 RepID=A0ABW1ZCL6_9BACT|nr:prephenate dehydratase domain-containing protein [Granulicella cerasi]
MSAGQLKRVAIQGELGSNSHMATLTMLGSDVEVVPCQVSADVIAAVLQGDVDGAVLPIENSLHGSVAEHYDLFLTHPVRPDREISMRIVHNLIAAPGVKLEDIHTILSHPVALSQCRRFLSEQKQARAASFYDTAGSVKHVMEQGLLDTAGIAPALAAQVYDAEILVPGVEDHAENYTRFHLVRRAEDEVLLDGEANKVTAAFAIEHRPGSLVDALQGLAATGANLTKIESRPVPGKPWEYVFYVDFRFDGADVAEAALASLREHSAMVKEIGRYRAAES